MDLNKFKKLASPVQNPFEWRSYLEFIETYFRNRSIKKPMVVEIGVFGNAQKNFYEKLLGYEHIGIDIDDKSKPDIIGDSKDPAILEELKKRLNGRPINLLFIDGDHSYQGVKSDYEKYGPLVKNIITLHDVVIYKSTVAKFWQELMEKNKDTQDKTFITINTWHTKTYQIGTGIILIEK